MRRLRVTARLLAAVLLALAIRAIVSGVNAATGLTGLVIAGLLVVTLLLMRQGRRLEPPSRPEPRR